MVHLFMGLSIGFIQENPYRLIWVKRSFLDEANPTLRGSFNSTWSD